MPLAAIAIIGISFRLLGLGRSAWLDESWVANSVNSKTLTGMFYHDSWLQTSPPVFLPFVLSYIFMFLRARRVLTPRFTCLACALFTLSPLAILFSKALKQYNLELAVSTLVLLACVRYLERRAAKRFRCAAGNRRG